MLIRSLGRGVSKVFSKSAEVFFLKSVKCVSNLLPSPSDYPLLESLLYNTGYYDRLTFTLYIQINNINLINTKHKYQIIIKNNNESQNSIYFDIEYIKRPVDMAFKFVIRPFDTSLIVEIVEKKLIVDKPIASINIDIGSIISNRFQKNIKYDIVNTEAKSIGSLTLSFHYVSCIVDLSNELWHKAVIKFIYEQSGYESYLERLDREDKLVIMSSLLNGNLYIQSSSGIGWEELFSKIQNSNDRYVWNLYENEMAFRDGKKPKVVIPILAIKCVNSESNQTFKITYLTTEGEVELIFKHEFAMTIVEASNSYIQMLRRHLEHLPNDIFSITTDDSKCIKSTIDTMNENDKLPDCINEMYAFMNT